MSEENDKSTNGDSTNPVHFEEFVRQQLTVILTRLEKIDVRLEKIEVEMVERFVQLGRQGLEINNRVVKIEEHVKDIDYKLDDFIKEQIRMKREWRDYQGTKTS